MKVIQVHNYYQQAGGEDAVVAAEREMLEKQGNVVIPFYKANEALGTGLWALGKASLQTLWNWETYSEFRKLLKKEKPDLVHCHNTFPLISPSVYWACTIEKVPVVQTLHNYRLLCLNSCLFRQGRNRREALGIRHEGIKNGAAPSSQYPAPSPSGSICEKCLTKSFKLPGIRYGCYRDSKAGSLVVALMLLFHKLMGTWSKKVTAYTALTEFQKQKMIEGGLPADKIFVKPNFIATGDSVKSEVLGVKSDLNLNHIQPKTGAPYALFVGRLSPEKGCDVLIRAWSQFQEKLIANSQELAAGDQPQLIIVGDGPEREALEELALSLMPSTSNLVPQNIHFLGSKPKSEVLSLMHNASFLLSPSVCYETFGLVVLEAGLLNTPSIIAEPGTVALLIDDNKSGLLFQMGNELELADKIEWAFEHSQEMTDMGEVARLYFEQKYSAKVNYSQLMGIYQQASLFS